MKIDGKRTHRKQRIIPHVAVLGLSGKKGIAIRGISSTYTTRSPSFNTLKRATSSVTQCRKMKGSWDGAKRLMKWRHCGGLMVHHAGPKVQWYLCGLCGNKSVLR